MKESVFKNLKLNELRTFLKLSSDPQKIILRKKNFHSYLRFGDVVCYLNLTNRKGLFTKAIMRLTKSRITHSSIYVGKGKIIDSTSHRGFVDYGTLSDVKEQILVILRPSLSKTQKKKLHKIINKMIKSKPLYDKRGIIRHTIYKATGLFPHKLRTDRKFFCSEFVYECFSKADYPLGNYSNSEYVSPTNIFESEKLRIIFLLNGVNGFKFSRNTWDTNKKIQLDSKKILIKKIK